MKALEVDNISKSYDDFEAVRNISFSIPQGNLFGLLGPNGAGKTTTMRMILSIILPDSGSIHLFGEPFSEAHKNRIGYLPEERGLYTKMKVIDHLVFLGEMKGMSSTDARKAGNEWLDRLEMSDRSGKKIEELSKGLQQKIQFIGTVIHRPKFVIMDEPFTGLDPVNTRTLKDTILFLKENGTTIVLSTHQMDQAERLCDDICLINRGEVILQGNLAQIKQQYRHNKVIVEFSGDGKFIDDLPSVDHVDRYANYVEVTLKDSSGSRNLFKALADADLDVRRFEAAETSLNQIFFEMVGGKYHA